MNTDKLKIIFIGGSGRSGTTLLDRLLGQVGRFYSLGEIHHIWERSFIENQLCGCGKPFKACEFWQAVVKEAFGGFEKIDAQHILNIQRSVARIRYTPLLIYPSFRPKRFQSLLEEYKQILERLYNAISKVSDSEVLIDSSKAPPHAFILSEISNIDLSVIHLVRDSRAVVYSWQRKKKRPEIYWKEEYMPRMGLVRASGEWMLSNWLVGLLKRRVSKYRIITYEALASSPKSSIAKILEWIGINRTDLPFFVNEQVVRLGVDHTVSGNPIRFKHGKLEVLQDIEWEHNMSLIQRFVIAAATYPLIKRYYPLGPWKNKRGS